MGDGAEWRATGRRAAATAYVLIAVMLAATAGRDARFPLYRFAVAVAVAVAVGSAVAGAAWPISRKSA